MTRDEAITIGSKTYNGKPCKCGSTLKYVSGYSCVNCTTISTLKRDASIGRKYATSEKGKKRNKRYRASITHKDVQERWRNSGGSKKEYQRNKETYKRHSLLKYGLSLEQFNEMRRNQNFACKICNKHENSMKKGLAIDHCHQTQKVRGLLCKACNTTLGNMNDDPNLLQKAIDYLKA